MEVVLCALCAGSGFYAGGAIYTRAKGEPAFAGLTLDTLLLAMFVGLLYICVMMTRVRGVAWVDGVPLALKAYGMALSAGLLLGFSLARAGWLSPLDKRTGTRLVSLLHRK